MNKIPLPRMKPFTARQFNFYQIPQAIVDNELFSSLDGWAIILYGMMLNRAGLSAENADEFVDENGDLYIIFTVEEAMQRCHKGNQAIIKYFKQLENVGLIERKRQGLGKPSITYVNDFTYAEHFLKCENHISSSVKTTSLKMLNSHSSNNNTNKNNLSNNQSIISQTEPAADVIDVIDMIENYRQIIYGNIEYEVLSESVDKPLLDNFVEIMLEVLCSSAPTIRIAKRDVSSTEVKRRFLKIDYDIMTYAITEFSKATTKINNIKAYMLTTLYNAPVTFDASVQHGVSQILYGEKKMG